MIEQHDFESKEVTWKVDGITVYDTLTQPTDRGPRPGINFCIRKNKELPFFNKLGNVRNDFLERRGSLLSLEGLGRDLHARFVTSQPFGEIGHENID